MTHHKLKEGERFSNDALTKIVDDLEHRIEKLETKTKKIQKDIKKLTN